jgi:hypothetical protein
VGRLPGVPALMPSERLQDLPKRQPTDVGALADVEARLDADSPQSGPGLRATFAIHNAGGERVELVNPLDLLQWQLLDKAGSPLDVPRRAPNLRVHRLPSAPWKLDSAVPIIEVRSDGERADTALLDSPALRLEQEGELAVTFEFELPSGDYRLSCLVTLIDAVVTERSRIVRSEPLAIRFDRT